MRPNKCTKERTKKISDAVRAGAYPAVAAQMSGIGERTFYDWMRKGRNGDPEYANFYDSVKDAESEAEIANVALIRQAAMAGTWTAAAWWLERKFPDRWGRKDRVQAQVTTTHTTVDPKTSVEQILERYNDDPKPSAAGGDTPSPSQD